jgi:hypothetical protein
MRAKPIREAFYWPLQLPNKRRQRSRSSAYWVISQLPLCSPNKVLKGALCRPNDTREELLISLAQVSVPLLLGAHDGWNVHITLSGVIL